MNNSTLLVKREKYQSCLGQLIDLKQGILKEIVIRYGDDSELLMELLENAIFDIDEVLKAESNDLSEEYTQ